MKHLLFVNKKKQKNFIHSRLAGAVASGRDRAPGKRMKFFCFFLFTKRSLALVLLASLTLAACGRKGPPNPPGPPDQIIFPKSYPAR